MLLVYPYCVILFLKFDIDSGVREGDVHLRCDLRKSAKEVALKKDIVGLIAKPLFGRLTRW